MTTTAVDDILIRLERLESERKKLIEDHAQPIIKMVVRRLFDSDPYMTSCTWRQFTPYFNDGDPCEFSFYGLYIKTTNPGLPESLFKDYDDGDGIEAWALGHYCRTAGLIPKNDTDQLGIEHVDIMKIIDGVEEAEGFLSGHLSLLLEAFGDHCKVTCDRDTMKMEVDSYDHD